MRLSGRKMRFSGAYYEVFGEEARQGGGFICHIVVTKAAHVPKLGNMIVPELGTWYSRIMLGRKCALYRSRY